MSAVRIIGLGSPFGDDRLGWEAIDALRALGATGDAALGATGDAALGATGDAALGATGDAALGATGGAALHRVASPASELLPLLQGAQRVILVDAVANGAPPGTLVRCGGDALRRERGAVSSHGVSVDTVLDLAEALQQLPDELLLIGLAIDTDANREAQALMPPLTPAVARAMPALIAAVAAAAGAAPGALQT